MGDNSLRFRYGDTNEKISRGQSMISGHDLEAFGYYDQVEAQRAVAVSAVEKGVKLQNETMQAGVVAFEMAWDWISAPMRAAAAVVDGRVDLSGLDRTETDRRS